MNKNSIEIDDNEDLQIAQSLKINEKKNNNCFRRSFRNRSEHCKFLASKNLMLSF